LQVGLCYGLLQRKRPTAVGQADYYGVVANTAARIMAKASPGQILIEGHLPFTARVKDAYTLPHNFDVDVPGSQRGGTILLVPRGHVRFKGLPKPTPLFEVIILYEVTGFNVCKTNCENRMVLCQ
jgi:class 3 adenylate cyclase